MKLTSWRCLTLLCVGLLTLAGCKPPQEAETGSAREVLEKMAAAYKKASSYQDMGVIIQRADVDGKQVDRKVPFSVAMVRPNKLRLAVYQAQVVVNGEQMFAAIDDLPDQQLLKDAPPQITSDALYADELLKQTLTTGIVGPPITLTLLMEKAPLAAILKDAKEPVLGKSEEIDGRMCCRVDVEMPTGTGTFWIDRENFVLRRYDYPTSRSELAAIAFPGSKVKDFTLSVEFKDASLDAEVQPAAFAFEPVKTADVRKFFVSPNPAQLLAKKIHAFSFFDLEGNVITDESLSGRIAVIQFWTAGSTTCRDALVQLAKVQELYKNEGRIAVLAVNVDSQEKDNQALIDFCAKNKIELPILRDPEGFRVRTFQCTETPPYTVLLDARGIGQDFDVGANPELADQLTQKLERLLAGDSVYQKPLQRYRDDLARQERLLSAKAAERSQPAALKLTRLWKSTDVAEPGNILVIEEPKASPRLFVLSGPRAVVEVALDGKLLATHPLDIDAEQEAVTLLRTAAAADGTRCFAAFGPEQQRVHVFDAQWKKLFSYPPDALEPDARHKGIADCELADLDGDGKPELYVGYLGVVGVQAVSLEGKRLFSNRTLTNVCRLAAGERDDKGRRPLLCGTVGENVGTIVLLDEKLERRGEVLIPDCPLRWFTSAELPGGKLAWCGFTIPRMGENTAVGLDLAGKQTWKYALPEGLPQRAIAPIIAASATWTEGGRWLLPGVDGSVHVLAADGKLLDKFNYGTFLSGLATATIDGKPALIIASPNGLEALRVE